MRKILFTSFILLSALFSNGQVTFQKTFGGFNTESAASVQQTSDGGYVAVGYTESFGAGLSDIYVVKTDANGDSLWSKTYGGTSNEWGYSIQQTSDGGFIIGGYTVSVVSGGNFLLIKTDSIGNLTWAKVLGAGGEYGYIAQQTFDGGYILIGMTGYFGAGDWDVYLIKTDANGDSIWTRTFGGTGLEYGYSVQQTSDSGFILTGQTNTFGAGNGDIYLIKTDANGDTLWTRAFGGTGLDYAESVQQTTDGGYIVAGLTYSFGAGSREVYVIRTNINGDTIWTKTYGGADFDNANCVTQTSDGGFIIAGITQSFGAGNYDYYLIRINANGDTLWSKTIGGTDYDIANSIKQTSDGGFIIAGSTYSFGSGGGNFYLVKTDGMGNNGCNEGNPATIVGTPATIVGGSAIVGSANINVVSPTIMVGSGCFVTTLCTTVGTNEITTNNSFLISPNPSSGNFEIKFSEIINKGTVEIFSVPGERIFSENIFNESKKEIKLKNISSGIYFVKVFDGEKSYCRKIVVEHN